MNYSMYRTVPEGVAGWDGLTATVIDNETGKYADYIWVPMDMLLHIDFYDSEGEYQGSEISSEVSNPIPRIWRTSPYRAMEIVDGGLDFGSILS